jgi:hypothetical protein
MARCRKAGIPKHRDTTHTAEAGEGGFHGLHPPPSVIASGEAARQSGLALSVKVGSWIASSLCASQ